MLSNIYYLYLHAFVLTNSFVYLCAVVPFNSFSDIQMKYPLLDRHFLINIFRGNGFEFVTRRFEIPIKNKNKQNFTGL